MSDKRNFPTLSSDNIPVEHFELTLVWPVYVQAVRNDDEQLPDERLDPAKTGFLQEWAKEIQTKEGSNWEPVDQEYPHGPGSSYAEYCYFHPFVRNFLYVSRGDIRAHSKANGSSAEPRNRNLEIFRRTDLEPQTSDNSKEQIISTLTVDCLLYTSPSPRDATLSRMPSSA